MLLYVDPPAYGLPSAGPESLAAIAFCVLTLPGSFAIEYPITAESLITRKLPSLHDHASGIWLAGFQDIKHHLEKSGFGLSENFDRNAEAQTIAYNQMMHSSAYELTLSYLFADGQNRDVFLQTCGVASTFPNQYIMTSHFLRKTSFRLDELLAQDEESNLPQDMLRLRSGGKLRGKARQIRLEERADDVYNVLEGQLCDSLYLFGSKPHAVDCMVFGHLALHLFPDVPNDFLASKLQKSYPRTWRYLVDLKEVFLDRAALDIVQPHREIKVDQGSLLTSIMNCFPRMEDGPTTPINALNWHKATFASTALTFLAGFIWFNELIVIDFTDT